MKQLRENDKSALLHKAFEIAKAAAGSGNFSPAGVVEVLETTYRKLIALSEEG